MSDNEEEHKYDSMELLRKYGFKANSCCQCGIKNSELGGKLIQCGKCRKAHYCSVACFNADLGPHSKFCTTGPLERDPRKPEDMPPLARGPRSPNVKATIPVKKDPIPPSRPAAAPYARPVPKKAPTSKAPEPESEPSVSEDAESLEEIGIIEDAEAEDSTQRYEREQKSKLNGDKQVRNLRVGDGNVPESAVHKPEVVDLNEVNQHKGQYSWEKPDWTKGNRLRKTEPGKTSRQLGVPRPATTSGTRSSAVVQNEPLRSAGNDAPAKLDSFDKTKTFSTADAESGPSKPSSKDGDAERSTAGKGQSTAEENEPASEETVLDMSNVKMRTGKDGRTTMIVTVQRGSVFEEVEVEVPGKVTKVVLG